MRMIRSRVRLLFGVTLLIAGLASCSEPPKHQSACGTDIAPGLAIAVGSHSNSPAPHLPANDLHELLAPLEQAAESNSKSRHGVTLVQVDGDPTVACPIVYFNNAKNGPAKSQARDSFEATVLDQISRVKADGPESDPLKALAIAGDAAGDGGTVVLLDSGLQTRTPLNFGQSSGLISASPDTVVAALRNEGELPDLGHRRVILAGIGYTAAPQAQPSLGQRGDLIALWYDIATAAGAEEVTVKKQPSVDSPLTGLPEVSRVKLPKVVNVPLRCGGTATLFDSGPVSFIKDSTEFVDNKKATAALTDYARQIVDNPSWTVRVVGNIAHYGRNDAGQVNGLSRGRAERVADVLLGLGVDRERIKAVGGGWGPVPNKTAPPDVESDPLNRRVSITARCNR